MTAWYLEKGPESDVVVSSRIRLARNLRRFPFPSAMTGENAEEIIKIVWGSILRSDNKHQLELYDINSMNPIDRQLLVEKHLASPDLLEKQHRTGVIISRDEKISIMVNEEDHLRIQCLSSGLQLREAYALSCEVDRMLEENGLEYAFSNEFGYLTCCPTNIGTGIRASVMLHLPALAMTGYLKNVLEACSKMGAAVRGIYGENTEASGNMFQISNQVTLGQSEEEILSTITNITMQVIESERTMRKRFYSQQPHVLEDRIFRAYGIFTNARIISAEESLKLMSSVRLGIYLGIIKDINIEKLNQLMLKVQPAYLQKELGMTLRPDERDIKRAGLIRAELAKE